MPKLPLQPFKHIEYDGTNRAILHNLDQAEDELLFVQMRERAAVVRAGIVGFTEIAR